MKTQKITLTIVFSLFAVFASAQGNNIQRPISKDVQKISNKSWLGTEQLLTVASVGYPYWTISKGVQLRSNNLTRKTAPGNMVSTGYPFRTISKGVHRLSPPAKAVPARPFQ